MDANDKKAHERARRRALARAAGVEPSPKDLEDAVAEGPPPSINVLISRLTSERREWRDGCTALLVQRGAETVPALLGALGHASPLVRYHATAALAELGDERAILPLVERLGDIEESQGGVAAGAESALRRFGARALPALLEAAEHAPERVRTRAVRLLGRVEAPLGLEAAVLAALRHFLRSGAENVQVQAATALWKVAGAAAADDLIPALADPSRYVRSAAAEALAQLRRPEARPILAALLADPEDLYESRWAEELLELLG